MSSSKAACNCDQALDYRKKLKEILTWLEETHTQWGDEGAIAEAKAIRKLLNKYE